jgi:hypothetical protein
MSFDIDSFGINGDVSQRGKGPLVKAVAVKMD